MPYASAVPRDGLPCVPNSGIAGSQSVSVTVNVPNTASGGNASPQTSASPLANPQAAAVDQRCGEGGTCMPISGTQLVRGVTGQCLEYDNSRAIAGDQTRHECLIWDPNPVFAGPAISITGRRPPDFSRRNHPVVTTAHPPSMRRATSN